MHNCSFLCEFHLAVGLIVYRINHVLLFAYLLIATFNHEPFHRAIRMSHLIVMPVVGLPRAMRVH